MRRSTYDNGANNNNVRIDARTGEAKQFGLRNVQRGTGGEIIGGVTRYGLPFGTKDPNDTTGNLGKPDTPGLDRLAAMNSRPAGESFAATEKRKRAELSASGAFGKGPQNLAGRQSLFKDMQAAGGGGITGEMKSRAQSLGVSAPAWKRVAGNLPQAPAMLAAAKPAAPAVPPMLARTPSWKQPAIAKRFAVPPVANPQAIGEAPVSQVAPPQPPGIAAKAAVPAPQQGAMLKPAPTSVSWKQMTGGRNGGKQPIGPAPKMQRYAANWIR